MEKSLPRLCRFSIVCTISSTVYFLFWYQDHIGTASQAGVQSNPAAVAAHDFYHHDAIVRLGRGVNAINRLCYNVNCRIETKSVIRAV